MVKQESTFRSIINFCRKLFVPNNKIVSFYELFRYGTCFELFLTFLGIIFAIITSLNIPCGIILYGEFTALLVDRAKLYENSTPTNILKWFGGGEVLINASKEENNQALSNDSSAFLKAYFLMWFVQVIFGIISIDLLNFATLRQITRIRKMFFECTLRQDMAWYDTNTDLNIATKITEDLDKMKNGIGEKLGIFIYLVSTAVFCVIIALIYGWKLTLVIMTYIPLVIACTILIVHAQDTISEKELKYYAAAGKVAEEVLTSIRTVFAFGGEKKEIERYSQKLKPTITMGSKKGIYSGIGYSVMLFMMYLSYAVGFWFGIKLILEDRYTENPQYTVATSTIICFCISHAAQHVGYSFPYLQTFSTARVAATSIFEILDQKPVIDSFSTDGATLKNIKGEIEFLDIYFNYPSRPDVNVLQGLHLKIKSGERVAIVGESGCGKSTLIQLVQRIYDPNHGKVLIDGNDISKLNVKWYRQHIGVVGQEPVLFATSIANNIALGKPGATQEQIEKAATEANCHDFIMKLPKGYDTIIGENNSQLSGGQKQRIAIARALIKKPVIILLDEATSALDSRNEAEVQKTLDNTNFNCTTLIVSHRLSTIRNVDRIIYIKNGIVVESGSREELMNKKQHYYNMTLSDITYNVETKNKILNKRKSSLQQINLENDSNDRCDIESDELKDCNKVSVWKIMKFCTSEWPYLLTGIITSVIVGISYNAFAFFFGETYQVYLMKDPEEIWLETNKYAIYFLICGIIAAVVAFMESYVFNMIGIKLKTKMQMLCFESMLKQEIGWYDEAKNSVGALCFRLSSDTNSIQEVAGTGISLGIEGFSSFLFGICISLFFSWKLTVVSIVLFPLLFIPIYLESLITNDSGVDEKRKLETATKIAVEAITNIRTVQSLGQESYFLDKYVIELEKAYKAVLRKNRFRGIVFSFGQASTYLGYVLCLWYGSILIVNEELNYISVIIVTETFIYGAWLMGLAIGFTPNLNTAKISATRIFQLLDRNPKIISPFIEDANNNWKANGEIKFSKVQFSYPNRPEIKVLDDLDLLSCAGSTIALVGESGCGKSTCTQLIQRLYDPIDGVISLDNKNIAKDISLTLLRSQLSIVSQEPVLFDRTIAENIAYGDNSRQVTQSEIIDVSKKCNIHNFISSLPMGYNTNLGVRGSQLSGGQKQRIAIARALIRNPRVLLLDEATSALDQQSEKLVQSALDEACKDRTCIIITHRLSTIQNADFIYVLEGGKIAEQGTHHELIAFGGLYSNLYNM